uniref:Putative serine/threonine protein kinase n=2 Tax=Nonomuraea gerenzanensis TaxID=93944 RepID=A0A1M4ENT6_9ACTN|nr:serine/threonine-protein kinase [Nonomuraea gerenzanensis]SBP00512.1 putative serine/threonine protein kinase [Nonomuraea gerenzanensis]
MVLHAMNDDRLGPYRLLRRLGEGGMGVVHLAVDPQGRQVAIKVLRGEVAGDEVARRRLSREVETMRRVRSKYIAEVLDADVTGHRPYIVTRYVPGPPLDEIVKNDGPLDLPALLRIAHGVASALAVVHSVGVIHRDLKPGNVLIMDGEPVLIDFGIAQAVDATRLTQTGMFIGTPGYLAPEIIEGQEAGPEVDIHAWAGTLLYAGTGQPPFGKGTLEMIFYNITAGKADISAAPAELQPLLKAAFQRNPSKRPKAAELAEQTARMLPKPAHSASPDEISTVPRPAEPAVPPKVTERPSYEISTPPVTPKRLLENQDQPAPPQPQDQQYVSLLPNQPDPWPTRRVSPEELRQIQREAGVYPPQPAPATGNGPAVPPHGETDVPTRRVRPDSPDYRRVNPQPGPQSGPQAGPDYGRPNPVPVQPPPYIPAQPQFPPAQPDRLTKREPYIPGVQPGKPLQRSRAYGVAGAMLLVLMIVAAVFKPVLVAIVALPVAILLRAADLAQPQLATRRAAGAAALDVVRVFAYPAALAKSAGITLALVLYALILGLPVTLLLTVVAGMDSYYALAWGAAIALWTVCAGPGVEGPGKQMRRTLSSLVPSRTAAMVMAGVLAAGAALSLIFAYSTFGDKPEGEAIWTPLNVQEVADQLDNLGGNSGG